MKLIIESSQLRLLSQPSSATISGYFYYYNKVGEEQHIATFTNELHFIWAPWIRKKNRRTPLKTPRMPRWIILNRVWFRLRRRKEGKKERNKWMPTPSGDFSFFPNWGIESRILLSYKPPSPSLSHTHHPGDMNHFQPPGPLPQTVGTSSVQRRRGSHLYDLISRCGPK